MMGLLEVDTHRRARLLEDRDQRPLRGELQELEALWWPVVLVEHQLSRGSLILDLLASLECCKTLCVVGDNFAAGVEGDLLHELDIDRGIRGMCLIHRKRHDVQTVIVRVLRRHCCATLWICLRPLCVEVVLSRRNSWGKVLAVHELRLNAITTDGLCDRGEVRG